MGRCRAEKRKVGGSRPPLTTLLTCGFYIGEPPTFPLVQQQVQQRGYPASTSPSLSSAFRWSSRDACA
jgi:hypothetical protein